MIPSRPLDLGGIIGESIRIIRATYWRMGLMTLIAFLPGWIVLYWGVSGAASDVATYLNEHHFTTPESENIIRDYVLETAAHDQNFAIYRILYAKEFKLIDKAYETTAKDVPVELKRETIKYRMDSLFGITKINSGRDEVSKELGVKLLTALMTLFIYLLPGVILLVIGAMFQSASLYDLGSRSFEERQFNLAKVFRLALTRNTWMLLIQYILVGMAMVAGFSIIIGIGFAISPILGALLIFPVIGVVFFAVVRLVFSQVVLVSENLGPIRSAVRSFELTNRNFWRVVGILFIGLIMAMVVGGFIRLPIGLLFPIDTESVLNPYLRGENIHIVSVLNSFDTIILGFFIEIMLSTMLTASFLPSFITTFYYDLRTRLDGPLDYNDPTPPDFVLIEPATITD